MTIEEAMTYFSTLLVLTNTVFIGAQMDLSVRSAQENRDPPHWVYITDLFYTVAFMVELTMRICMKGRNFLSGSDRKWNVFDMLLVFSSVMEHLLSFLDLSFIRILRIFRTIRVMRVIRVIRIFRELRLMVASIISALASLIWAFILLAVLIYLFAILFLQGVTSHFEEFGIHDPDPALADGQLPAFFGSLGLAMESLFCAITGGFDWQEAMIPLKVVSIYYGPVFLFYVSFVVIGVMNILTGIFVENANHIASVDRDLVIDDQIEKIAETRSAIRQIFTATIKDVKNEMICRDDVRTMLADKKTLGHLQYLDLDIWEIWGLFDLLDTDHDGEIPLEEFIGGIMRLRGSSRGIDLATMMYENRRFAKDNTSFMKFIERRLNELEVTLCKRDDPRRISRRPSQLPISPCLSQDARAASYADLALATPVASPVSCSSSTAVDRPHALKLPEAPPAAIYTSPLPSAMSPHSPETP